RGAAGRPGPGRRLGPCAGGSLGRRDIGSLRGPTTWNSAGSLVVQVRVSCRLLLVSGSVRRASTNTAVLRTVQADAGAEAECILCDELAELPHFNPDDDHDAPPVAVVRLRDAVHRADA